MKAKYKLLVEANDGKEYVIVIREYSFCTKPARMFKEQVSAFDGSKMHVSVLHKMKVYLRELAESINAESRGKGDSPICSIYLIRIDASVSFYDLLAAKGGSDE